MPLNFSEPEASVAAEAYLASLPPARREPDAIQSIRDRVEADGRRVIVLDDDPTGTQTVHDVPVLTTWSYSELRWALEGPSPTVFVLTNSRSLDEGDAALLNRQIAERLVRASADTGVDFAVTSRSDSTLRGHFHAETRTLTEVLADGGKKVDGTIVCPCFFEAGRVTVDDVQWVRQGDELVPAARTEFAADPTFGYAHSNLAGWVEEKTAGSVRAGDVLSVGLEDIRRGGPGKVAEILQGANDAQPVIVNAAEYADLEVFVLGLLAAERAGKTFVYRTGPSFVRVRGGIPEKGPLGPTDLHPYGPARGHGLVLVGSHVQQTTRQLQEARRLDGLVFVELSVPRLLNAEGRKEELGRVAARVNAELSRADVVVYTSREVLGASRGLSGLEVGAAVSDALVGVMRRVDPDIPLGFVVGKGGITSSDVATRGLGVRRAEVAGQMMPGIISAWTLPPENEHAGMPYVVFPGNVGGDDALAKVIEALRGGNGEAEEER